MKMIQEDSLNKMMMTSKMMMNNKWIMILLFKMNSWSTSQWNYSKLKIIKIHLDIHRDLKLLHCNKHPALQIRFFLDQNLLNNKILIFSWEIKTQQNSKSETIIKIKFINNNNSNKLFILSNQETVTVCILVYNLIKLEITS